MSDAVKDLPSTKIVITSNGVELNPKQVADALKVAYDEKIENTPTSLYHVANYCVYLKNQADGRQLKEKDSGRDSREFASILVNAVGGVDALFDNTQLGSIFMGSENLSEQNKEAVVTFFDTHKPHIVALIDGLIVNKYNCRWQDFVNDMAVTNMHGGQASKALDNIIMNKSSLSEKELQVRTTMIANILAEVLSQIKTKAAILLNIDIPRELFGAV